MTALPPITEWLNWIDAYTSLEELGQAYAAAGLNPAIALDHFLPVSSILILKDCNSSIVLTIIRPLSRSEYSARLEAVGIKDNNPKVAYFYEVSGD
jgi:hypothetical protein